MKKLFFILFIVLGLWSCEKEANVEYEAKNLDKTTFSGNRTTLQQNADGYYCAGPPFGCQAEVVIDMTFDQLISAPDEFVANILDDKPANALVNIKQTPEAFLTLFEPELIRRIVRSEVYLEIKPTAQKHLKIVCFYEIRSKKMLLAYPLNIVVK